MKWLPDLWLSICYLASATLSLVVLTSIAPTRLPQQALMFGIGLLIFLYLSAQEADVYKAFAPLTYPVAVVLLILTLLFGETIRGSTRWIPLGTFQLQPGEFAKPLLVLAFAYFLERFPPRSLKNILLNLSIFLLPTWLIFRQPDLGTALVITSIFAVQIFISGLPLWFMGVVAAASAVSFRYLPQLLHDYQLRRLATFIDPFHDPLGSGYNVIQSMIAIGSGGWFGKGLGHGTQSHLRFLPENHTDFIFASLAEELGLIGSILVIFCLSSLLYRLLYLATHTPDSSSRLIFFGVFGYLSFQTFVNIGMNLGVAPVTGVTLPLISYGGSSILATAITLGIASSLARASSAESLLEIK